MTFEPSSNQSANQLASSSEGMTDVPKIEELAKRVSQLEQNQGMIARAQKNFLDIFEKMEQQQERLVNGQEILTNNQASLANAVKQLADSQLQLTRFVERLEERLASTSAAVERLDRLMDYLIRENPRKKPDSASDENEAQ